MGTFTNISLSKYRKFLQYAGCVLDSTNGGHEKWTKEGLTRPIIVQNHIDPVPPFIVKNALRNLGITTKEFINIIHSL